MSADAEVWARSMARSPILTMPTGQSPSTTRPGPPSHDVWQSGHGFGEPARAEADGQTAVALPAQEAPERADHSSLRSRSQSGRGPRASGAPSHSCSAPIEQRSGGHPPRRGDDRGEVGSHMCGYPPQRWPNEPAGCVRGSWRQRAPSAWPASWRMGAPQAAGYAHTKVCGPGTAVKRPSAASWRAHDAVETLS